MAPKSSARPPAVAQTGTLQLGSRTGREYPHNDSYQVVWEAHDVVFTMSAVPSEGQRLGKSEFEQLIRGMTWP